MNGPESTTEGNHWAGKVFILSLFFLALGAASFAWWYQYTQGDQSLEFWGTPNAVLIRKAPQVEILQLETNPASLAPSLASWQVGTNKVVVLQKKDISKAAGLINARHPLIQDVAFLWDEVPPDTSREWQMALRFSDKDQTATLLFDLKLHRVHLLEGGQEQTLNELMNKGFSQLYARHFLVEQETNTDEQK